MASRKRTTSKKTGTAARGRTRARNRCIDQRWSILLFGLGVLFTVLSFIQGEGVAPALRNNVLFGIFGICGWAVGPFLVYLGVRIARGMPFGAVLAKGLLAMAAVCALVLVFGKTQLGNATFLEACKILYEAGRTSSFGAGFLALCLGYTFVRLFGYTLARILLVLLAAGIVVLFVGPARLAGFFREVGARLPKPEYEPRAEKPEEEFAEQMALAETETVPKAPLFDAAGRRGRGKKSIDIPYETEVKSTPGPGLQEEVDILPGGTFGQKALENLEPPQPAATTPEEAGFGVPAEEDLPFVSDMPAPLPNAASTQRKVFDYEAMEQHTGARTPGSDLFLRENAPEPKQIFEPEGGSRVGEGPDAIDPETQALIDKAAQKKPDEKAMDTREAEALFSQEYRYPSPTLFDEAPRDNDRGAKEEMRQTADKLVGTLQSFGVATRMLDVSRGPSVTRYEVKPETGVKINRITNLADDIALNLAAEGVRIEAPIPGKAAVGIEVPNKVKATVSIRSILESPSFVDSSSPLPIALGKDIAGDCVVADLTRMPHLLIAGATGSGKSVCVNATIMSFVYKCSPEDVRLVLIDPKVVELAEYNGIPHLMMPVVTEPRQAAGALGAMVAEMERRYRLFAENKVRDIKTFNKLAARSMDLEKLPYIAIIIDELADLMMTSGKEVEDYICRIAQKARAAGMHLIVATQRPSVDVITGLIKANIPSRIAFSVSSQVDSRTILDGAGAEKLLGMGDMLFMPVGANKPLRVQGTYVKDKEISKVLKFLKQTSSARYDEAMIEEMNKRATEGGSATGEGSTDVLEDETFVSAVEMALDAGQVSTSNLQRRLRIGYARAGRIVDEMEQMGIVSGPNGSKPRDVLISRQQWQELVMNAR